MNNVIHATNIERVEADVCIVGGGFMGAATARALAKRGQRVVLLEKGYCGAQASGVNYGGVRRQGRPVSQLPLSQRAYETWKRLPETIGTDGELLISGHLRLARSEADLAALHAYAEQANPYGLDLRVLEGPSFRKRYPWLGVRALGGSMCPGDGHANPRLVSPAFARAARAAGADVRDLTPVCETSHDGRRFLTVAHGPNGPVEVTSAWLINTAGAWGNQLAGRYGDAIPMKSIYPNLWVTEPLPFFIEHNLGVYGGGIYARQVARGNVVIGGGRGVGDGEHARPLSATTRAVMTEAIRLLPALRDALVIRSWSGVEGETPDDNPVIAPSRTTANLLHAFGFSGGGFQLAPGVGEVLADLVLDGATATPIGAFSLDRFDAAHRASQDNATGATS
ncbi:FAD-dependent oxidoreductase [Pandoraea terrae]|uniref:FAD-dependent oxidoreductase n=1 Tax=Pandoraea terrae TaxID=1537710 RepID=A0A5E4YIH0_9BURK|nr:FAD-binding oxidoreductase [Pandoraea terrae]VVE48337.1 FAD-dependent oxidoreductase [Pandoraea terrae]